jgi:hypothetical protein
MQKARLGKERLEVFQKCKFACVVSGKGIFMTDCKNYMIRRLPRVRVLKILADMLLNAL